MRTGSQTRYSNGPPSLANVTAIVDKINAIIERRSRSGCFRLSMLPDGGHEPPTHAPMPIFRFEHEKEFIRFLNDTEWLRHGIVEAVVRRGNFGGPVDVVSRPMADADLERVSLAVPAYHGRAALEEATAGSSTRGMDLGHYIETIHAEPGDGSDGGAELTDDLLLMFEDHGERFEKARDLVFRFGCEREFRVMAGAEKDRRIFLFRLRGLGSHYPVLEWEAEEGYQLFRPLQGNPGCFILRGYQFPLRELSAYHPNLGAVNLIGENGWWWRSDRDAFHPLGDLSDIHFAGARAPTQASALPDEELPKCRVELRLEKREGVGLAKPVPQAGEMTAEAQARLQSLEKQRWEIDREIERLRHLGRPTPTLYWFGADGADTLVRFVTRYPPDLVGRFLYFPLPGDESAVAAHLVVPRDRENPDSLPEELASSARAFCRQPAWFQRHGISAFLPQGARLTPPLEFSSPGPLLGILGGTAGDHLFVLDTDNDGSVVPWALPLDASVPLEESVKYLNAAATALSADGTRSILEHSPVKEHEQALEAARERMAEMGLHFTEEFTQILESYQEQMEKAVELIQQRKEALDHHLGLLPAIEQFEAEIRKLRNTQLAGLAEFLEQLEASLNTIVTGRDRQEHLIRRKFQSVLNRLEQMRQEREDELSQLQQALNNFQDDRDPRRDKLIEAIDALAQKLEEEPIIRQADELTRILDEAKRKLRT